MKANLFLLLYSTLILSIKCAPMTDEKGMNYLMNFGYTNNKTMGSMTGNEMKEAIEVFQKFVNIPITGILDEQTKKMMQLPRCKMPDKPPKKQTEDIATFVYTGRWNNTHLTYKFLNYPINNNYNKTTVVDLVTKAMKLWINRVDLVIEQIHDDEIEPDINIEFVDNSVLSTPEGIVLAYAAAPADGDMYYLDVDWNDLTDSKVDLYQIAAHEFGHSLGLNHLDDINSVMYPMFVYKDNFQLNSTDIKFVEVLYGKKYSLCEDGNIDAALATPESIYMFRDFQVWRYIYGYLQSDYPKLLSEEFPGLKSRVNASFYHSDHIYFIQGKEVLKFNGSNTEYFARLENDYDSAVTIQERLYTFKGSQYWRYDINTTGMSMVRINYPRNISSLWKGVPRDIDAVYFDEDVHFFKGTRYFRFDIHSVSSNAVETLITEWEGCKNNK